MRIHKYTFLFAFAFLASDPIFAQDQFTIEEAIQLGIKNNYNILVANNNATIAANDNSLGNAGMLPIVDINASTNFANNATKQEFNTGAAVDKAGVKSNSINSGVYLTWTLFNGLKMFARWLCKFSDMGY